jgi:hypothetical protein
MRDPIGAHPTPAATSGMPESGPSSGTATPSNESGMDYRHAVINRIGIVYPSQSFRLSICVQLGATFPLSGQLFLQNR